MVEAGEAARMDRRTYLGLDIGTSSVKALLIDADQRTLGEASAALDVSRPHPLWSEQNPDDWVEAVEAAVQTLRRRAPDAFAQIAGVGLSGQMHGATFLDAQGKPLRAAILWNDGRAFAECEELTRRVPDFLAKAGNLAMPGFTAPKALWLARHEPETFAKVASVLLPKDYVRFRLTGEKVSEMSDAAGTLWLDIAGRRWSGELVEASGLKLSHMPSLVEGSQVSAYLSPEIAASWGLSGKIPVAGGGGDNAASAVGVGAVEAGEGFVSLGTSGVIFSVTDKYVSLPQRTLHAFCHALPGRWHGMSVMLSAAASLAWAANLVGRGDRVGACVDAAEAFSRNAEAAREAPIFLPYLSGERTPHNDPQATGMFAGLTAAHGPEALLYAVMEGVAFSFADGVDVLREAGAAPVAPLLVGGGARSGFWGQMIADATGLSIDLAAGAEAGAALGAARLAMLAAGAGDVRTICARPETQRRFEPNAERAALYGPRLKRYRALYGAERGARA
jgi:xylulokinase